ncbi:MAG: hypothetical protein WA811_10900 [Candidatus Sulfotelmatobacter sp.]
MFEQLDQSEKAPKVAIGMSLGILAVYLVGAFGGLCLFIVLGERPFGIQIATAIVYTYFAFWYVFFPTRGQLEKYSLRNKTVQRQIPRLLAIHCAFLILILLGQTVLFALKPWVVIVSSVVVFFAQVLVSRRILSRSLREGLGRSDSE